MLSSLGVETEDGIINGGSDNSKAEYVSRIEEGRLLLKRKESSTSSNNNGNSNNNHGNGKLGDGRWNRAVSGASGGSAEMQNTNTNGGVHIGSDGFSSNYTKV